MSAEERDPNLPRTGQSSCCWAFHRNLYVQFFKILSVSLFLTRFIHSQTNLHLIHIYVLISFIHVDFSIFFGSVGCVLGQLLVPLSRDILLNVSLLYLMYGSLKKSNYLLSALHKKKTTHYTC